MGLQLLIGGARGSTPAPGEDFVRYGGHTSSVALTPAGADRPTLILDSGTGIRRLIPAFRGGPFHGTILYTHLHWDHTQGLPFFASGDRDDARVRVLLPEQGDPLAVLSKMMSPPHFPIGPAELRGEWSFGSVEEGDHEIEGFRVRAREVPHKGGRTFGYRITDGTVTIAFVPDHHPTSLGPGPDGFGEVHEAILDLVRDVDVLMHDAQYTAEEFPDKEFLGHAAVDYAVRLAAQAQVGRLLFFHHDPQRTDDELDAIVDAYGDRPFEVAAAAEGLSLNLTICG